MPRLWPKGGKVGNPPKETGVAVTRGDKLQTAFDATLDLLKILHKRLAVP
jgi:hypothetical protein